MPGMSGSGTIIARQLEISPSLKIRDSSCFISLYRAILAKRLSG
jgi:hypothetical protein